MEMKMCCEVNGFYVFLCLEYKMMGEFFMLLLCKRNVEEGFDCVCV